MLRLVPASIQEYDLVFRLYREAFRHHIEKIWGWDDEWQTEAFKQAWRSTEIRLVKEGGQVAGYMQTRRETDRIFLVNLAIAPGFRCRGVGTEVMHSLIDEADRLGLTVGLSVFRTNRRVLAFYEKLGFEIAEKTVTGYDMERRTDDCD